MNHFVQLLWVFKIIFSTLNLMTISFILLILKFDNCTHQHVYARFRKVLPVPEWMIQKVWRVQSWTGLHLGGNLWALLLHAMSRQIKDFIMSAPGLYFVLLNWIGRVLSELTAFQNNCISHLNQHQQNQGKVAQRQVGSIRWSMASILVPGVYLWSQRSMKWFVQEYPSSFCKLFIFFHSFHSTYNSTHVRPISILSLHQALSKKNPRPPDLAMHTSMECPKWHFHPLLMLQHRYVI